MSLGPPDAQRKQLLTEAQAAERRADYEGAAHLYARAGALDEAARVFLAGGKFLEAGRALLQSINYDRKRTANLDAAQRKAALKAAICFGRAGDVRQAVELYMVLGERLRAAELLRSVGDYVNATRVERATGRIDLLGYGGADDPTSAPAEGATVAGAQALEKAGKLEAALEAYAHLKQHAAAGRVAQALGRLNEAAAFYLQANMPFEAGLCFIQLGDPGQALKMLVQVPREHPRFREACIQAIVASEKLGRLEFQLDNLVGKFVAPGPQDDREVEAFYRLAGLYERHGFPENARECFRRLLAKKPGYRDSVERLRALDLDSRGSEQDIARVFAEESSFRAAVARHDTPVSVDPFGGDEPLPDLPDLPSLDETGPAAHPAAVGRAATMMGGFVPGAPPGAPARPAGGRALTPVPIDPRTGRALTPAPAVPGSPRFATAAPVPVPSGTMPVAPAIAVEPSGPASVPPSAPGHSSAPGVPMGSIPSGAVTAVTLTEGAVINGRYRLEKKIGQGGMGAVFKAVDLELEETLAIKFLSAAAADEALIQRFKQEVSLSRQFNHPNIIRLYDLGTWGEHKFITMELLSGRDLSKLLTAEPMEIDKALGYLVQACAALQAVHDRGVIHRDIKPENFFVTDDGVVKVMDFGIAKRHNAAKALTRAGMMAGTPQYMAPEQINDFGSVTHVADIYSMGIIAYQLCTGVVPFDGEELMPILVGHLTSPPESPRVRNPKIPPELEAIILKLLAKKPADRFQSCREVGGELARLRMELATPRR